ncbi:MAG TPA: hypothetical protein V6C65_17430 [Allocoleopsis sp.]
MTYFTRIDNYFVPSSRNLIAIGTQAVHLGEVQGFFNLDQTRQIQVTFLTGRILLLDSISDEWHWLKTMLGNHEDWMSTENCFLRTSSILQAQTKQGRSGDVESIEIEFHNGHRIIAEDKELVSELLGALHQNLDD